MLTSSSLFLTLQSLAGLVGIVVTGLGAAVAVSYVNRSRWVGVVAAGFALQVVGMLASQFMFPVLMRLHPGDVAGLARGSLAISVLGVIARIVVVGGVIGLILEFARAKRRVEPGNVGGAA